MKRIVCLSFIFLLLISNVIGQQTSSWAKWSWLIGEWKGEGSGQPGEGAGVFTFKKDLDEKILVRTSHTVYPAANNKPATIHDDLLIVYADFPGSPSKAIYFDNEGHTIHYTIGYTDSSIVFTSNKIPGVPTFRLTYTTIDTETVNTTFELSQDGEKFTMYVSGKSKKVK